MSFAKNIDKNLSSKYYQKRINSAKKSTIDAIKTTSKRTIQKTAGATGDLIGNKIAEKITSVLKKSVKELSNEKTEVDKPKKDTYLQKKDNKLLTN